MDNVLIKKDGNIATVSLNRTKVLNAFNSEMLADLTNAIIEVGKDPDIYVMILNSSIDKAFTAGGDIKEEAQLTYDTAYDFSSITSICMPDWAYQSISIIASTFSLLVAH